MIDPAAALLAIKQGKRLIVDQYAKSAAAADTWPLRPAEISP